MGVNFVCHNREFVITEFNCNLFVKVLTEVFNKKNFLPFSLHIFR